MSDIIRNKKIGARTLTSTEVLAILPTYERLLQQIEEMRVKQRALVMKKTDSYTNNIGVLGARGSGKTSVLKTLMQYLEENNDEKGRKKNIILPMIVPETMSECMNLMAAILGLFKKQVDEISILQDKQQRQCWEKKNTSVQSQFDTLVKKFCFIQKDFRQILVHQYTTETEYARNSSKIFNSDSDFLPAFNRFIDELLKYESFADDAMIFLPVDDIDLSTHRCTDVVKTLLSYINHPRIITIISGDLDTFEEALTLDFLRQEQALNGTLLEKCFMQNTRNSLLLERKKLLSYEYLKKILPPIYRHSVKKWDITDRGNYKIEADVKDSLQSIDKTVQAESKALADLLTNTFRQFGCAAYFQYGQVNENEPDKKECIPQVFHMFDDTARGLNNVYYTLLNEQSSILAYSATFEESFSQEEVTKREKQAFRSISLFLETIVASNRMLSNYRNLLLQEIIQWGDSFKSTKVRFDNLFHAVYDVQPANKSTKRDGSKDKTDMKNFVIYDPVERFTLFIFVDFANRLLSQSNREDAWSKEYQKSKQAAILDLLNYPAISGSTQTFEKAVFFETPTDHWVQNLFLNAELDFILHYFQYTITFSNEEHAFLIKPKEKSNEKVFSDYFYIQSYSALNSIKSQLCFDATNKNETNEMKEFGEICARAVGILSNGHDGYVEGLTLTLEKILNKLLSIDQKKISDANDETESLIINLIINTFSVAVKKASLFNAQNELKTLHLLEDYIERSGICDEKLQMLKKVNENDLWSNEFAAPIAKFLESKTNNMIDTIKCSALNQECISLEEVQGDLRQLADIQGSGATGIDFLNEKIKSIRGETKIKAASLQAVMGTRGVEVQVKNCISSDDQMTINGYCANNRLKKARSKVLEIRNKMQGLVIDVIDKNIFTDENVCWFYFYALMRQASGELDGVYKQSVQAAKLTEFLNQLEIEQAKDEEEHFANLLNIEEMEKLFSLEEDPKVGV